MLDINLIVFNQARACYQSVGVRFQVVGIYFALNPEGAAVGHIDFAETRSNSAAIGHKECVQRTSQHAVLQHVDARGRAVAGRRAFQRAFAHIQFGGKVARVVDVRSAAHGERAALDVQGFALGQGPGSTVHGHLGVAARGRNVGIQAAAGIDRAVRVQLAQLQFGFLGAAVQFQDARASDGKR